jgi:hypothetical protein
VCVLPVLHLSILRISSLWAHLWPTDAQRLRGLLYYYSQQQAVADFQGRYHQSRFPNRALELTFFGAVIATGGGRTGAGSAGSIFVDAVAGA